MIRDITIGQYYPADSPLHKMDPRVKLFATVVYVIALFCFKGIVGLALITGFLYAVVKISKVPFKFMTKGLKAIVVLVIITSVFNLFATPGEIVFWKWGSLQITDTGIINAFMMTVRLVYLILGTSLMTLTTTPNQLTNGLETAMAPLNKFNVPVHSVAMMMSIALRFIPILIEETDKIMKAQMARGADFENGNIIQKAKAMVPLLVPLFVSAFRRAEDLAMAMEARCYNGGEGRTKMKPLKYEKRDRVGYAVVLGFLLLVILVAQVVPFPQ